MENIHKEPVYSVPVGPKRQGQTQIRRHPKYAEKLLEIPQNLKNLADFWDSIIQKHSNNQALEEITYKKVDQLARSVGSWLVQNKHEKIYLYAKNRPEWTITDIACWNYGITNIPLYDTLGNEAFNHIIKMTQGTALFTTDDLVTPLLNHIQRNKENIKIVVFLNESTLQSRQKIQKIGIQTVQIKDLYGHKILERPEMNLNHQITYSYTSGTTGMPKGVIGTHRMFIVQVLAMKGHLQYTEKDVHLTYLPIAHMFERFLSFQLLWQGANIRYSQHPVTQITKDFARARPTSIGIVPRLLNRFYQVCKQIHENDKSGVKIKGLFGGNLKKMVTGSAPVSPQILTFFRQILQCDVREGYGQTQTTAGSFITYEGDINYGHVGGINACTEFKLVDVPEMNCFTSQNPPRGEVCVRGGSVFKEYYLDQKSTKQTIDEEGWNHTGDIAVILPNGALKLVDRKKNLYKLSQGQYIAPQKIENIYLRCPYVSQCFVYGDSLQSYNVAIIHPNLEILPQIARKLKIEVPVQKLIEDKQIEEFILRETIQHGRKEGLMGFQLVKRIKLWPVSFRILGLYTSTMKLQRQVAKKVFNKEIQEMYKQGDLKY